MSIRQWAKRLKHQTTVVYYAARDPRTPWFVRLLALAVAAYALSPIDLIPDFIPVLGYLDDLLLVPFGLTLAIRLVPPSVLAEHRAEAARRFARAGPHSRVGAVLVVLVWALAAAWFARALWSQTHPRP